MKRIFVNITIIFIFSILFSCKKDKPPRVSSPSWTVDNAGAYAVSMTAVVRLPSNLFKKRRATDKMGAFIGDQCRGIGKRVLLGDTSAVFFVLIHGKASEKGPVQFQYYSAHTSYIYQTKPYLGFVMDGNYGTVDQPEILELKVVK